MGKGGGGPESGPQIEGRESEGSCCKGLGLDILSKSGGSE